MQILVPLSGGGRRYAEAGFLDPKPFIKVGHQSMIELVGRNLGFEGRYIFIVQKKHLSQYPHITKYFDNISSDYKVVEVDGMTEGAACSALLAKDLINTSESLILANSDQFMIFDRQLFTSMLKMYDGAILTFQNGDPKWSYVSVNHSCLVKEVAEKKVISSNATCGCYGWAKGSDFVESAEAMIKDNIRVNGEFYVCPTFNWMINKGKKIISVPVKGMYGLGVPADLEFFLEEFRGLL